MDTPLGLNTEGERVNPTSLLLSGSLSLLALYALHKNFSIRDDA